MNDWGRAFMSPEHDRRRELEDDIAPSDAGWNKRYLTALARYGLRLIPLAEAEARGLMGRCGAPPHPPLPTTPDDPDYPYPSVIVSEREAPL